MGFLSGLIKSAVPALVSGFTGGLGGGLADLGMSFLGNQLIGRPNSAYAHQQSLDAYGRRYQMTTADMRAAGLNPILAASSGFGVGQSPQMMAPQLQQYNIGSTAESFERADQLRKEKVKTVAETKKTINEAKLIRNKAREVVFNIKKLRSEKNLIDQNEENAVREMFNLEQDFFKKANEISKLQFEILEIEKRTALQDTEINFIQANKEKIKAETKNLATVQEKIKAEIAKLKKIAEVYDRPGGLILAYIQEIMKSLGMVIGVVPNLGRKGR